MVSASVSDEFAQAIDEQAEWLLMAFQSSDKDDFRLWLAFECFFDGWEKESEFPDRVLFMRRFYHLRLNAIGTHDPDSFASALSAAFEYTLEKWPEPQIEEASDDA